MGRAQQVKLTVLLAAIAVFVSVPAFRAPGISPDVFAPENRTTGNSKQIAVFGGTRQQRSDLVRRAEDLKAALLRKLQIADNWKSPVLLVLAPGDGFRLRQPPVFVQAFNSGDAGKKVQVDIVPSALSDRAALDAALLRALLLELALRKQTFVGNRFVEAPGWMAAAMSAALKGTDPAEASRVYSALLEAKGMPALDKFLSENPVSLRGRARDLYDAQALALFESLAEQPGGRDKILQNLTLADPAKDPVDRFGQTWPEYVSDPSRLARVWALGVARLSSPGKIEFLSARETSEKLGGVLRRLAKSDEAGTPSEAVLELGTTPEGRFLLEKAAGELQTLGFRAHPLYAALVQEYRAMFEGLSRKKRRGFAGKFNEAEELRIALDARSAEITEFMDTYQLNADESQPLSVAVPSGMSPGLPASRNDSISRFMDSVEQRGW